MKKKLMALISALVLCVGLMVPVSAADQTFTDVPATHWAHDAVDYVVNLGLFNGTSATTFSPNTPMTRAMLIQALFRYAGSPQLPDTWVSRMVHIIGTRLSGDATEIFWQTRMWKIATR